MASFAVLHDGAASATAPALSPTADLLVLSSSDTSQIQLIRFLDWSRVFSRSLLGNNTKDHLPISAKWSPDGKHSTNLRSSEPCVSKIFISQADSMSLSLSDRANYLQGSSLHLAARRAPEGHSVLSTSSPQSKNAFIQPQLAIHHSRARILQLVQQCHCTGWWRRCLAT